MNNVLRSLKTHKRRLIQTLLLELYKRPLLSTNTQQHKHKATSLYRVEEMYGCATLTGRQNSCLTQRFYDTECVEYCQHVLRAKSRMTCFSAEAKSLYELRHLSSSAPPDMSAHWVTMDNMQQVKWYIYIYITYIVILFGDVTFEEKTLSSITLQEKRSVLSPPPSPHLPLSLHISPSFLLVNWQQLTSQLSLDLRAWTISSKQACEQQQRSFQRGKIER